MTSVQDALDAFVCSGAVDDSKGLRLLKKALKDNGFNVNVQAADVMLSKMQDNGLSEGAVGYYRALAYRSLSCFGEH